MPPEESGPERLRAEGEPLGYITLLCGVSNRLIALQNCNTTSTTVSKGQVIHSRNGIIASKEDLISLAEMSVGFGDVVSIQVGPRSRDLRSAVNRPVPCVNARRRLRPNKAHSLFRPCLDLSH
jgi:hypothetical protein